MSAVEPTSSPAAGHEDYVLFNPDEGRKDKEGRIFMVRNSFKFEYLTKIIEDISNRNRGSEPSAFGAALPPEDMILFNNCKLSLNLTVKIIE